MDSLQFWRDRRRWVYALLFLCGVVSEVLIGFFVRDTFFRPYFGDVLVVVVLCCFVRIIFPGGTQFLSLYVFLCASAVEVGQYFNYAALLGVDHIPFFRIFLGSTFSGVDLICYAVGAASFFVCENTVFTLLEKVSAKKRL